MDEPDEKGDVPSPREANVISEPKLKTIVLFVHPEYTSSVRNKNII